MSRSRSMWTVGIALLVMFAGPAWGGCGVQGRTAWRGDQSAGVMVSAFRSIADMASGRTVATSAPSGQDGTYRLELPPGSYYLTAREGSGPLQPGQLYGYFSGAPVQVVDGVFRNVGFNLIRVPREGAPATAPRCGLSGEISFQDAPLQRAYLYVYQDAGKDFKGPAYVIQPVEKGTFRVNLPPGKYWLLARKRVRGGQFGPIETGDYFNYYYGNPVTVVAGQVREIKLETVARLSIFDDANAELPFSGVRGKVLDAAGRPVARMHVFAYRNSQMTGTPDYFSPPTGKDGTFELALPGVGPFYLLARQEFGGPAGETEFYGRHGGGNPLPVRIDPLGKPPEVTIHVAPRAD